VILLAVATSGPLVVPNDATDADVLRLAEESFAEGVRLRDEPDKARPLLRKSADLFEELRRRGAANPALFRDQGNACLLADDLPGAILAYRRGLRLAPNDTALQQLLADAREQVNYNQMPAGFGRPPVSLRPPWLPRLPMGGGLLAAFAVYSLGWLSLARWWMVRRGVWLSAGLAALGVTVMMGALLAVEELQERDRVAHPLVVIAEDGVLLRKGNGEAYPRRYESPVNRGVEARLLYDGRPGWVQIELSGGETGWVPRAYVLIDRP
jgi:hypothetical protein